MQASPPLCQSIGLLIVHLLSELLGAEKVGALLAYVLDELLAHHPACIAKAIVKEVLVDLI